MILLVQGVNLVLIGATCTVRSMFMLMSMLIIALRVVYNLFNCTEAIVSNVPVACCCI